MDGYIVHGGIGLARGSFVRIEDGRGIALHVREGELWITQEGDARDYLVRSGKAFEVQRNGLVVAYVTRRASLTLTAPVAAHYARRISMALPGASPCEIYDRARDTGGTFQALRHWLTRLWTNAYARHSIPTTAAL